jgi:transposase
MRLAAAKMFEQGQRQRDVVRRFGVARSTASKWHQMWREGGREAMRSRRASGRPRRLTDDQVEQLKDELLKGPEAHGYTTNLWTLPRIAQVIKKLFGVRYHAGHVWRLMRRMGWTCQKPARRAKERNEEAIRQWRQERWPRLKRGQCAKVS